MKRRQFMKHLGGVPLAMAGQSMRAEERVSPRRTSGPNVLLIVSDEHRRDASGCYGSPVKRRDGSSPTPHIDALATGGCRFEAVYCPSPLCAPSRAAYMTGCHPHTTTALHHQMQGREAGRTRFPGVREDLRGMGECFRDAGYRTATIGKVHVHGELVNGWDLGFETRKLRFYTEFPGDDYKELKGGDLKRRYREMAPYSDMTYRQIDDERFGRAPAGLKVKDNDCNEHYLETLIEDEEEMADSMVTRESIAFMRESAAAGEPFFIHVGLEKPHRPWSIHQRYLDRFDPATVALPATVASWVRDGELPLVQRWCHSPLEGDAARRSIAAYYACVSAVDDCVGRLVETCRELGLLDDTVIIYTSDHGENLFDHGLIEKHTMLEASVAVPLVVHYPKRFAASQVVSVPCSLIDLLPTLAEMAGLKAPEQCEGVSLIPLTEGRRLPDRLIFSEFYQKGNNCWMDKYTPVRMALDVEYKYIYTHAALDQLYARDPDQFDENRNLALLPEQAGRLSRMRLLALHDWELDEYPQLTIRGRVVDSTVQLDWEEWPDAAGYDVFRGSSPDPAKATLLARLHPHFHYTDTGVPVDTRCHYWVVAQPRLRHPFVDRAGLSRYGELPVRAAIHPMKLPVTPRLTISLATEEEREARYQPLLGFEAFGTEWIHIGHRPTLHGTSLQGAGASLMLLAADPVHEGTLQATIRTRSPGPAPEDTVAMVLNYDTMDRYYRVLLTTDGRLIVQAREGKRFREVAGVAVNASPLAFNVVTVRVRSGSLEVDLNGDAALRVPVSPSLPAGRFGLESDMQVSFEAKSVRFDPVG